MIITMFGIGMSRWVKMTLLAAAVSVCTTATAVAQALPGAPIVDSAGVPSADENALELGPGEMLMNPEMIPAELRPKFPPAPVPGEPSIAPHHPCPHCGTPGCGGACAVGVSEGIGCGGCAPGYVARFDALYMTNDSAEGVTLSDEFRIDEFDYEWGGRALLRRQFDCVNGYEVVFTMIPEWEEIASATTAGPSNFTDVDPDFVLNFDAFDGPANQIQSYRAEYTSIEANRTYNGWDVATALIGFRFIDYEEEYFLASTSGAGSGLYDQETENLLFGLQAGLDLDYPLSRRLWSTVKARGGVFANFAESETFFTNDVTGVAYADNEADDEDIAGLIELGTGLRYDLGPALSIYGGYEIWYLANVATAADQLDVNISSQLGNDISIDDDVFMHGLTVGAQLRY